MCDGSRAAAPAGPGAGASIRLVLSWCGLILTPFFLIYFRMQRIGREHIPAEGPVILAANHRSFLDPFVIATMARRPDVLRGQEGAVRVQPGRWAGC